MFLDTIHGAIDRRVLLNYRIDPEVLKHLLPSPFIPKLHRGFGIGGACMIRFKGLRPKGIPEFLGLTSENAAHRIAVEWEQDGQSKEGVFIPRRDTNSLFNSALGGRAFPGIFNRSVFHANEDDRRLDIEIITSEGERQIVFRGELTDDLPKTSIFSTLTEAASFFALGATGYSQSATAGRYHGMELRCLDWSVQPLKVIEARAAFYEDTTTFPAGSIELDSALLMRAVAHEWHSRPDLTS